MILTRKGYLCEILVLSDLLICFGCYKREILSFSSVSSSLGLVIIKIVFVIHIYLRFGMSRMFHHF